MYRRDYDSKEDAREYVGKSPLKNIRIPAGPDARFKFDKEGYDEVERTTGSLLDMENSRDVLSVELQKKGAAPAGMVQVASGKQPRSHRSEIAIRNTVDVNHRRGLAVPFRPEPVDRRFPAKVIRNESRCPGTN